MINVYFFRRNIGWSTFQKNYLASFLFHQIHCFLAKERYVFLFSFLGKQWFLGERLYGLGRLYFALEYHFFKDIFMIGSWKVCCISFKSFKRLRFARERMVLWCFVVKPYSLWNLSMWCWLGCQFFFWEGKFVLISEEKVKAHVDNF